MSEPNPDLHASEFMAEDSEGDTLWARKVNMNGQGLYVDVETSRHGVFLGEHDRRAFAAFLLDGLPPHARGSRG